MRVKFAILHDSLQQTKEPKVTRACIWRVRWVRQSENMMLLGVRRHLWPIIARWIIHVRPKSWPGFRQRKFTSHFWNPEKCSGWNIADWICYLLVEHRERLVRVLWKISWP
jgi:hypothetical protein